MERRQAETPRDAFIHSVAAQTDILVLYVATLSINIEKNRKLITHTVIQWLTNLFILCEKRPKPDR